MIPESTDIATDYNPDLDTCEPWELLVAARKVGLRHAYIPGVSGQLIVWGARTPKNDRVADALRARMDDVIPLLQHPAPFVMGEEERRFRGDVLDEPDILVGDLPWPVLKAMIVGVVQETIAAERAAEEWVQATVQRDAPARAVAAPPITPLRAVPPSGFEFRAGKVVRR